jgi:hypothetical protein
MSRTDKDTFNEDQDRHEQDHSAELESKGVPREHAPEVTDEDHEPTPIYEEFSDQDLADRAQELEIEGHDSMLNDQLIEAIRKKEEPDRVDATRAADQADQNGGSQQSQTQRTQR